MEETNNRLKMEVNELTSELTRVKNEKIEENLDLKMNLFDEHLKQIFIEKDEEIVELNEKIDWLNREIVIRTP